MHLPAPARASHQWLPDEMTRILIVDDDVDTTRSLARMLRELGHDDTRVEHSAATALRAAIEFAPSVIFVDIELPDLSGYDVALLLHQHPRLQQMRLIALTESEEHPGREQARTSGFERYLVKPVAASALQEVMDMPSR
jgi:CheY-like chemotaxis protein